MKGMFKASAAVLAAVFIAIAPSCSKEEYKNTIAQQETNIESYVNSMLSKDESYYLVMNRGVDRLVLTEGEGDSLSAGGTVSFYYAGYVMKSSSISDNDMFVTNRKALAESMSWELSDSTGFDILTLKLDEAGLVDGLRYGLEGVKGGQECYILFSGKYGFGKRPLGTIPANASLAYHIWVESISND